MMIKNWVESVVFICLCVAVSIQLTGQEATPANRITDPMKSYLDPTSPRKLQSILLKPEVQEELGIDRNTYSLLDKALSSLTKETMDLMKQRILNQGDPAELRTKENDLRKKEEEARRDALDEVFAPRVMERLKQLAYRIQIAEVGMENALTYGALGEQLELDEAEWKELAEKGAEIEKEKQAKIREIEKSYDEKLLSNLSPAKRKKLASILGEPFECQVITMERRSFESVKKRRRMPTVP